LGSFKYIAFEILLAHGVVGSSQAWGGKRIISLSFQICYAPKTLELIVFKNSLWSEFTSWAGILRIR